MTLHQISSFKNLPVLTVSFSLKVVESISRIIKASDSQGISDSQTAFKRFKRSDSASEAKESQIYNMYEMSDYGTSQNQGYDRYERSGSGSQDYNRFVHYFALRVVRYMVVSWW